MNEIEKQVLENQKTILSVLRILLEERNLEGYTGSLNNRRNETMELLNPEESKELPCDMSEDETR